MDHRRSTRFELRRSRESRLAYRRERKTGWSPLPCRAWQSRAADLASGSAAAISGRRCTRVANRQEKARCVPTRTSLSRLPPLNRPSAYSVKPASTFQVSSNPKWRRQSSELRVGSPRTAAPCRDGYPLCLLPFLWQRGAQTNDWVASPQGAPWMPIDRAKLLHARPTRWFRRSRDYSESRRDVQSRHPVRSPALVVRAPGKVAPVSQRRRDHLRPRAPA